MPTFTLSQLSIDLNVQPLAGPLAPQDRQLAWGLYLALTTRPALREEAMLRAELDELIDSLRTLLERWPAAEISNPQAGHLGFLAVAVIELIFLPCLEHGAHVPEACGAVRRFCESFAREIAITYGFPDAGASAPQDLLSAWRARS